MATVPEIQALAYEKVTEALAIGANFTEIFCKEEDRPFRRKTVTEMCFGAQGLPLLRNQSRLLA